MSNITKREDIDDMSKDELKKLLMLMQAATKKQSLIEFVDKNAKGVVKKTLENTQQLLDHYGITIRYNEMTKNHEYYIPNKEFHGDTKANAEMAYLKSLARDQELPVDDLFEHATYIANQNAYHPVRDWVDNIEWDGKDRLQDYYATIQTTDIELNLKETFMRKWALSVMAALYHPNFSCEGVLVLYGLQATGKTSQVYSYFPKELALDCVKTGVTLTVSDKDSVLKATSSLITELGELGATFKRSDIEQLKGFITEKTDVVRPPYERKANSYSRRTVFYATVDKLGFLQDEENRRFWVLNVSAVKAPKYDLGQFWAQMKAMYFAVAPKITTLEDRIKHNEWGWFLSPAERQALKNSQSEFKSIDPIRELLDDKLYSAQDTVIKGGEWKNSTAILLGCGKSNVHKSETNVVAAFCRENGYQYKPKGKMFYVRFKEAIISGINGPVPKFKSRTED
jgi:putative DNA primase/helicase